jgi:uroporphyrinogen decarboxylase
MLSRERIIQVINHKKPDRIPIYGWLNNDEFRLKVEGAYGSIEAFEEKYGFDIAHLFPGFSSTPWARIYDKKGLEPEEYLDIPLSDPNDMSLYESIKEDVKYHKEKKGRFVYIQTPGCFEENNGPFGIENHLAYLLMYPDEIKAVYDRLLKWTLDYVNNCLDLGVDMIHISDDWGSQNSLLFSPKLWEEMIYPYHKAISKAVKKRGGYISLHSDGNINQALLGIVDIGYDVVHPFQESAGMSLDIFKENYRDKFTVLGGLDVQAVIGFGKYDLLEKEIKKVIDMFRDGGLIFCTTHMVQPHCSIEELEYAYDLIYEYIRKQ